MKKFKDFVNKLTLKQANILSLSISFLISFVIIFTILSIGWETITWLTVLFEIAMVAILSVGFYIGCFQFIFNVPQKEQLRYKKWVFTKYNLSHEEFIEVIYLCEKRFNKEPDKEIILTLLCEPDYRFYAKLIDNEKINLIVKDKSENTVLDFIITDFNYFKDYFKKAD